MQKYSYSDCLNKSYQVNWRIEDVLGGRNFDPKRRWLPRALSAADSLPFLEEEEKRTLTQAEMGSYAHIFGYVEEFIAPKMARLAKDFEIDQREAFDALTNFAAEEVKHMNLFRQVREKANDALRLRLALIDGEKDTARFVLGKSDGAMLLLTAAIEWLTQLHYLSAFREDGELDPLTKEIFKAHWLEESQHAKMDHMETLRAFGKMSRAERDRAVDELIELVAAVDGLLQKQAALDLENFEFLLPRTLRADEKERIAEELLRSKRYVFIESGVTHPRFQELFAAVTTPQQQERVQAALAGLLPQPA